MALRFVLDALKAKGHAWPSAGVQVNGDSGNDIELFEVWKCIPIPNGWSSFQPFGVGMISRQTMATSTCTFLLCVTRFRLLLASHS